MVINMKKSNKIIDEINSGNHNHAFLYINYN